MQLPFYIVDVFAEKQYEGNQLAVFEHDGSISDAVMLAMAKEINFAETTFINTKTSTSAGYDVRIFTPEQEIPFAGHPTLGTAFVIQQEILKQPVSQVVLNLKVGKIPVDFVGDTLWMQQINPVFGQSFPKKEVAEFLHISEEDILDFPLMEVSTGLNAMIVPVKNLAVMQKIKADFEAFNAFLLRNQRHRSNAPSGVAMACFVFCAETYSPANALNARMFWHAGNKILEDSATGSANGSFLSYLLKTNFLGKDSIQMSVEQGYEIPRPSILYHNGHKISETQYSIRIGGKTQWVSKGIWLV